MNKTEAKEIYDKAVKPYKDRWEILAAERDSLYDQWRQAKKDALEARKIMREVQKEAQGIYYKSIGE
jgi:prefoldin subunit 5